MEGMRFGIKWRGWMRECIFSPLLSILVNGRLTPQFGIDRGLRKGDPISPFLFNIVVEGLNCLLQKVVFLKLIDGLKINFHKSGVVRVGLGKTVESAYWAEAFKFKKVSLPITYLGFPLGGKPVGVVQRIEKIQRSFLWRDGVLKRKFHAEDRVEVCKSKANGGLGIRRILDKSKALLAKWIWRFGREENSLWRRVICSKYKAGTRTENVINDGFLIVVGREARANFWSDIKVEGKCFALAKEKDGVVGNFGYWTGQRWEIRNQFQDVIAWSANTNGTFSVGCFRRALESLEEAKVSVPKFLWKGICPPNMEIFLWQLWRGKVMKREVLYRCGMDQLSCLDCPFCNKEIETIDHLFLHCSWSNSLWIDCMAWWGVVGCINKSVKEWLTGWVGLCPATKNERVWSSLFVAIVWTIWETRNQQVFEGKVPNVENAA
ncbi:hypothetical protein Dsin_029484 [Dipteronia sinensis]|uniref:Reverse transcriptase zinc-binding domain-containing protein n=1 Tax=Dipteronia sinensis TaxID=43782 RepID=A0AAE0DV87_9ROSI|nr:hypothetical protein Dsin_029484 [Dipteronia sinensis]